MLRIHLAMADNRLGDTQDLDTHMTKTSRRLPKYRGRIVPEPTKSILKALRNDQLSPNSAIRWQESCLDCFQKTASHVKSSQAQISPNSLGMQYQTISLHGKILFTLMWAIGIRIPEDSIYQLHSTLLCFSIATMGKHSTRYCINGHDGPIDQRCKRPIWASLASVPRIYFQPDFQYP